MVGSASFRLAKECKRLCDNEVRASGVKEYSKHKKKEDTHRFKTNSLWLTR